MSSAVQIPPQVVDEDPADRSGWGWRYVLFLLRDKPTSFIGPTIVVAILVLTIVAPAIVPYDPEASAPGQTLKPPSSEYWFGTDAQGLDVFSRTPMATRTDIPVALLVTIVSMALGMGLGVAAGYFGDRRGAAGLAGETVLRIMDVLQAFPVFVLAMVLVAATGPSAVNVGIAVAFVNMPILLRLTRGQVLGLREMPFVEAARCAGAHPIRAHRRPPRRARRRSTRRVRVGLLAAGALDRHDRRILPRRRERHEARQR